MSPLDVFIAAILMFILLLVTGCTPCNDESLLPGCPIFPNAAPRE